MIHRRLLFTLLAGVVLFHLMLYYLSAVEDSRMTRAQGVRLASQIEQGAELYEKNCRSCHGLKGEGVGQLGPALSDEHFFSGRLGEVGWQSTLEDYIVTTTEHGRLMGTRPFYVGNGSSYVMPPWHKKYGGPLRDDQIGSLTLFVVNWEATATGKVVLAEVEMTRTDPRDPQSVAGGEAVFMAHCIRCHRYRDQAPAGSEGPDLSRIASIAGSRKEAMDSTHYIRESVLVPAAYTVEGYEDAVVPPCGAVLSETELVKLTAFLLQQPAL